MVQVKGAVKLKEQSYQAVAKGKTRVWEDSGKSLDDSGEGNSFLFTLYIVRMRQLTSTEDTLGW